jgi:hypothetical protein
MAVRTMRALPAAMLPVSLASRVRRAPFRSPVLRASGEHGVWLNVGHGSSGWAACLRLGARCRRRAHGAVSEARRRGIARGAAAALIDKSDAGS